MHRALIAVFALTVGTALLLRGETAHALTIAVDSLIDDVSNDGECSLREAIQNANDTVDGQPHKDCSPGVPNVEDTIEFSVEGVIVLTGQLPAVVDDLVIDGGDGIRIDGDGRGIFRVELGASLRLEQLELIGGEAGSGGAVSVQSGSLEVSESLLANNQAQIGGGAIYVNDGTLDVQGSHFVGNRAISGGAIYILDGTASVSNSLFQANEASDGGGGIISILAPLSVLGGEFNENSAAFAGGAIIVQSPLTIQDTDFHANTAETGGALFAIEGSGIQIDGASFTNNSASEFAGGAITSLVPLQVSASSFQGNTAPRGGAIDHALANAAVSSSFFADNMATTLGGAVHLGTADSAIAVLRNSTFTQNEAQSGGAVYLVQGSANLVESTFSLNSATTGGAVYNMGTLDVLNSTISANGGGGLYNEADATVRNVTFAGNIGAGVGGILSAPSATLYIANTAFARGDFGSNCELDGTVSGPAGSNLSDDDSCPTDLFAQVDDMMLGPLADNGGPTLTHLPDPMSPAVDSGDDAACPIMDQRGESRPALSGCDVGSVEVQEPPFVPSGDLFLPNLASQVDHP